MDIRLIHFTTPLSLYGFTFHTTSPDLHFVDSLYLRHLDWPAVLTLTSLYFYTSSKTLSYCLQKDLIISCTWDRKDQDQCSKLAVCRGGFRSVVRWFSLSSCFHFVHLSMYVQETQTLYVSYVSKSDSRPSNPQGVFYTCWGWSWLRATAYTRLLSKWYADVCIHSECRLYTLLLNIDLMTCAKSIVWLLHYWEWRGCKSLGTLAQISPP